MLIPAGLGLLLLAVALAVNNLACTRRYPETRWAAACCFDQTTTAPRNPMSDPATITETLTKDHRDCDRLLSAVSLQGRKTDWPRVVRETEAFRAAMERHFRFEEEVLFPPLEQVAPLAAGPTEMMRQHHGQIRVLLDDLAAAAAAAEAADYVGISETLHFLIQQHNAKEEGILYPLADRALAGQGADLAARLAEMD